MDGLAERTSDLRNGLIRHLSVAKLALDVTDSAPEPPG